MCLVWVESVRRLQNHASNMLLFANARAQVIGQNYVINGPILYRSEQMDSREDKDQDCSVDYLNPTEFG